METHLQIVTNIMQRVVYLNVTTMTYVVAINVSLMIYKSSQRHAMEG
jgi:hypothetical protein